MKQEKIQAEISGMTCNHCAITIEKLVRAKQGVIDAYVHYSSGKAEFSFDAKKSPKKKLQILLMKPKNIG